MTRTSRLTSTAAALMMLASVCGTGAIAANLPGLAPRVAAQMPLSPTSGLTPGLAGSVTVGAGTSASNPAADRAGQVVPAIAHANQAVALRQARVGEVLKTTAIFHPTPDRITYRWFRNTTPIPGVTGTTYRLTPADFDRVITAKATAFRAGYRPSTSTSNGVKVLAGKPLANQARPKITGTAQVGKTLTASKGRWAPSAEKVTYQWFADGKAIKGATKQTYKVGTSSIGKRISVKVTAKKYGYQNGQKTADRTPAVK